MGIVVAFNVDMNKNLAIILAGGSGIRFGERYPKQFSRIAGRTIMEYAIDKFDRHPQIHDIFLVVHPGYHKQVVSIIRDNLYKKVKKILPGGKTRQESAFSGLFAAGEEIENVLIHDAVRPLVSGEMIDGILRGLKNHSAVTLAVPPSDTIAAIDSRNMIAEIPDRKLLRKIQTPQGFRLKTIRKAHELARDRALENFPDDCSLILFFKLADVFVIKGSESNIKITYPEDVMLIKKMLKTARSGAARKPKISGSETADPHGDKRGKEKV
jgi:2-C-methyl-D-erythritol 4-phosphate cytidylyltransferase